MMPIGKETLVISRLLSLKDLHRHVIGAFFIDDICFQRLADLPLIQRCLSGFDNFLRGRPKALVSDHTPFLMTLACDHPKAFLTGHSYHPDTGNIGGCPLTADMHG
ncbi:hypothetical protein GIX45_21680 [Erwinia sp. CPCC 100877]|nr:hypothetical protein [Erwinia sp. CPCC 100877]